MHIKAYVRTLIWKIDAATIQIWPALNTQNNILIPLTL